MPPNFSKADFHVAGIIRIEKRELLRYTSCKGDRYGGRTVAERRKLWQWLRRQ